MRWTPGRIAAFTAAATVAVAAGVYGLVTLTLGGLDGSRASMDDVLATRPACGIGTSEFSEPSTATSNGFQEHDYIFEYPDRDADWVEANVLARFGDPRSAGELPSEFTTPRALSEMGTTTFTLHRSTDDTPTFAVRVVCKNTAGINGSLESEAVTTTIP